MTCQELDQLLERAGFGPIDRHFARFIERQSGGEDWRVGLAAALVSRARSEGHLCLDLNAVANKPLAGPEAEETVEFVLPPADEWLVALRQATSVVGVPGDSKPLILTPAGRLYLARYWDYEQRVARDLVARARETLPIRDPQKLAEGLKTLFLVEGQNPKTSWQQVAAFAALRKRLCVITGGPGTGKTTTLANLLRLLLEHEPCTRVALAAPTGKAAARMKESLGAASFPLECLVAEPGTIHRLLGSLPGSPFFRHNSTRPLAVDLLVIDEASMLDVALLAKVLDALPASARIILVGDKDQLASVEAGSVLGDLCSASPPNRFTAEFRQEFATIASCELLPGTGQDTESPLNDSVVQLMERYRAGKDSPIYPVSDAVIDGNFESFQTAVQASQGTVRWRELPSPKELRDELGPRLREGFMAALEEKTEAEVLTRLRHFQVLCAVRRGPYGVEGINRLTETMLREAGLIGRSQFTTSDWYHGRMILVTVNDPLLWLSNGDVGVAFLDSENKQIHVCFAGQKAGEVRRLAPVRLPAVETAYALTVHKSQGSEFEHVLLVLPDQVSPLLTRELLYTAITRAKKSVEIWAPAQLIKRAIAARVERASGLTEAIRDGLP